MTERVRGLEHGLTNYGDRDFALYLRRSFARSMGYSREMLAQAGRRHRQHGVAASTTATATSRSCSRR